MVLLSYFVFGETQSKPELDGRIKTSADKQQCLGNTVKAVSWVHGKPHGSLKASPPWEFWENLQSLKLGRPSRAAPVYLLWREQFKGKD